MRHGIVRLSSYGRAMHLADLFLEHETDRLEHHELDSGDAHSTRVLFGPRVVLAHLIHLMCADLLAVA
ncbi:hypothetical protein [Burkholderia sp. MSMB0856]|uniref:hypothetical protein n=1 Tax=Burkholderia sp. MSMB0856 TaxID=1637869 RepID=UPI00131F14C8|nr:hypothetical protein [Burkholderia sp. MSMB0856]